MCPRRRNRRPRGRRGRGFRGAGAVGMARAAAPAERWAGAARWPGNLGILAVDIVRGAALRCRPPRSAPRCSPRQKGWGLLPLLGLPFWPAALVERDRARSRDLCPALRLPSCAGAVAAAPRASRRSRYRRDDRPALPSAGDPVVAGDQDRGGGGARRAGSRRWSIFEVLLNATSMFNHSNVALPPRRSRSRAGSSSRRRCTKCIIRPRGAETDSNFGFNLPWWDRLFGTYREKPAAGDDGVVIGLPVFRDAPRADAAAPADAAVPRGAALVQAAEGPDQKRGSGSARRAARAADIVPLSAPHIA